MRRYTTIATKLHFIKVTLRTLPSEEQLGLSGNKAISVHLQINVHYEFKILR